MAAHRSHAAADEAFKASQVWANSNSVICKSVYSTFYGRPTAAANGLVQLWSKPEHLST